MLHPMQKDLVYRCAILGCSKGFNRVDKFKKYFDFQRLEDIVPDEAEPICCLK